MIVSFASVFVEFAAKVDNGQNTGAQNNPADEAAGVKSALAAGVRG